MKVYSIQYLRGLAALLVVVFHIAVLIPEAGLKFSIGVIGVDIFFVISGFIMWVTTQNTSPGKFIQKRIIRIVPLYWTITVIVSMVAVNPGLSIGFDVPISEFVKSLFFIAYVDPAQPGILEPVLAPGWTLNLEMLFYLVMSAALLFRPAPRFLTIALVLSGLVVAGWLAGPASPVLRFYTQSIMLEFLAGVGLGAMWLSGRVPQPGRYLAPVLAALVALVYFGPPATGIRLLDLGAIAFLVVFALLILEPVIARRPITLLVILGDASYSTYLVHVLVIVICGKLLQRGLLPSAPLPLIIATVLICLVVGVALFYLYERPVTRAAAKLAGLPGFRA